MKFYKISYALAFILLIIHNNYAYGLDFSKYAGKDLINITFNTTPTELKTYFPKSVSLFDDSDEIILRAIPYKTNQWDGTFLLFDKSKNSKLSSIAFISFIQFTEETKLSSKELIFIKEKTLFLISELIKDYGNNFKKKIIKNDNGTYSPALIWTCEDINVIMTFSSPKEHFKFLDTFGVELRFMRNEPKLQKYNYSFNPDGIDSMSFESLITDDIKEIFKTRNVASSSLDNLYVTVNTKSKGMTINQIVDIMKKQIGNHITLDRSVKRSTVEVQVNISNYKLEDAINVILNEHNKFKKRPINPFDRDEVSRCQHLGIRREADVYIFGY